MTKTRAYFIVLGLIVFLCVVATYEFLLPRLRRGLAQAPPNPANKAEPAHGETASAASDFNNAAPTRDGDARSDTDLRLSQRIHEVLTEAAGIQTLELTRWSHVELLAKMLTAPPLREKLALTKEDAAEIVVLLENARSTMLRQVLIVILGTLPNWKVDDVADFIGRPGLTPACAFALGHLGDDRALALIEEQLGRGGLSSETRDALFYGMAQSGPGVLLRLVEASKARLLLGARPEELPLALVRTSDSLEGLKEIALEDEDSGIRIAAIAAIASTGRDGDDFDFVWLESIAGDEGVDLKVRAAALRALGSLTPDRCMEQIDNILAWEDPPPTLLAAALDAAGATGISDQHIQRVAKLVSDHDGSPHRFSALTALVRTATPTSDHQLTLLIRDADDIELHDMLISIVSERCVDLALSSHPVTPPSSEMLDAIAAKLGDGPEDANHDFLALQLLSLTETHRTIAQDQAWRRLRACAGDDHDMQELLTNYAPVLGPEAREELQHAFVNSAEFVPRVNLATALARIPGSIEEEEHFFRSNVIPFFRTRLLVETGASLAYVGPGRGRHNVLAETVVTVFGRFGERSDVELLEALAPTFLDNQHHWPTELRMAIHKTLVETTGRAIDLINLGQAEK